MTVNEQPLVFDCEGDSLVGILSPAAGPASRGVLIVVGGPQYRAGSHRQFVLLARHLAERGIPALRFDYRGMGDSTGGLRTFERVGTDIRCAIDGFFGAVPGLKDVVIWGLCDAASAALFYARHDARVSGLALLNPWVHSERSTARAYLRHYYLGRLFDANFWRKLWRGEFDLRESAASLGKFAAEAVGQRAVAAQNEARGRPGAGPSGDGVSLPRRMEEGLRQFQGRVLVVLSGNDLVAREFKDVVAGSRGWRRLLADPRVTRHEAAAANHTFSGREWRDQVARWTENWARGF